uniref:Annexin 16 n=1 Tax=Spironucleus vortens TaxID=58336 RepID=A0A142C684_SPIVO|nr:annexin 16 [Spironucleus vortens]
MNQFGPPMPGQPGQPPMQQMSYGQPMQPGYPQQMPQQGYPQQQMPYGQGYQQPCQMIPQMGQPTQFQAQLAPVPQSAQAMPANYVQIQAAAAPPLYVYTPPPRVKYNRKYFLVANELRIAMKGIGTDNKAIIAIISQYNTDELVEIGRQYEASFGKNLQECLKSELSGNFGDLAGSMFTSRYVKWAAMIQEAIEGCGTDEKALMDLIVMCTPADLDTVRKMYYFMYNKDMYREVSEDINNVHHWCIFLKRWMRLSKSDAGDPMADVNRLLKGDVHDFIEVICDAGPAKYDQINALFAQHSKNDLAKTIEKKFQREDGADPAHRPLLQPTPAEGRLLHPLPQHEGARHERHEAEERHQSVPRSLLRRDCRGVSPLRRFEKGLQGRSQWELREVGSCRLAPVIHSSCIIFQ